MLKGFLGAAFLLVLAGNVFAQQPLSRPFYGIMEVDRMPVYDASDSLGTKHLMNFMSRLKFAKPADDLPNRLVYEFIVERDGRISGVSIAKGSTRHDAEFLKAIQSMHAWQPGTKNGKAVAVKMRLPVSCILWD